MGRMVVVMIVVKVVDGSRVRRATGVERERETFGSRFGRVRVCGKGSFRLGREGSRIMYEINAQELIEREKDIVSRVDPLAIALAAFNLDNNNDENPNRR